MGLLNFRRKSKKQSSDYPSTFIQSEVEIPSLPVYNEKYLSLSSPTLSKSQTFSKVPDTSLMDDIMNELGSSKDASSKPMPSSTTNPKVIRPLLQFDTPLEETVKSATNNPAASFELESATGQQKPLLHFSSIKKPTFQHQENKKLELQQENHTNNLNNRDEHTGDADEEEEKEEKEDNYILGSRLMRNQVKRHSAPVNNKPSPMPLSSSSASDTSNEPVQPSSKTLMDRMKERHRQEARRSSSSPFMDRNLSSPSMPIIAGATTDRFSHIADGSKNRPQKNMVQSQSCNMFMKPSVTIKNENCSFDIFNAPIQTQSDVSLSNTRRFHSLQHSYHQPALSSLPIQENEEDIPSLPRFALNRSVSAYPGFPTRSLQQQQQILLQQQQQQQEQQQMQQQQIQQQIELKQHQLEEQQRLQQQKLQQLHLQQKQQQEQNNINQAILDSIMSSSLEYEAGKHHLTSKPLYKRLPVEKYRKHHHHHHHHHQQHRHHHCSYHSNDSCKSIALHRCRTPPPESHHLAIDESKNKKEVLERPLSPVSLTDKEKLASIEDIIMNSSSSTLASDPKIKVVNIPLKLKRELQDMQLRRSSYSVPDLSRFSKENIPEIDENKWNTLCPISNSENKTKEREDKIQEEPFCRKRHRCRSKCCHHRHCYSSIKPCSNTLKHSQSTCSVVSEVDDMTHCHHKKSLCRSARHCKHH